MNDTATDVIDVPGEEVDTAAAPAANVASLVPVRPSTMLVEPVAPSEQIARAFTDYTALCERLLVPSDYQQIQGREFRKKSAWRKLAVAFGVSCRIEDRVYDRLPDGSILRAEVIMVATAPNGRTMDGLGVCDRYEKCCAARTGGNCPIGGRHRHCQPGCDGSAHFSHPEHDLPATAMTRATNRACSDLFGMGEVSAEEVGNNGGGNYDGSEGGGYEGSEGGDTAGRPPTPDESAQRKGYDSDAEMSSMIAATRQLADEAGIRDWVVQQGYEWPWTKRSCTLIQEHIDEAPFAVSQSTETPTPPGVEPVGGERPAGREQGPADGVGSLTPANSDPALTPDEPAADPGPPPKNCPTCQSPHPNVKPGKNCADPFHALDPAGFPDYGGEHTMTRAESKAREARAAAEEAADPTADADPGFTVADTGQASPVVQEAAGPHAATQTAPTAGEEEELPVTVEGIQAEVAAMTPTAVFDALTAALKSTNGAPKTLRKRLVDHILETRPI